MLGPGNRTDEETVNTTVNTLIPSSGMLSPPATTAVTSPGNITDEEATNIPLLDELHSPPAATNITEDSIANVSDSTEPDKCVCGADKPKTDNRAGKCCNCGKAVCLIKGCKVTYKNVEGALRHQPRDHTAADREEFRKHRATHCTCGAVRRKVAGKDHAVCDKCKRVCCTAGECIANISAMKQFYDHKI